MPAEKDKAALKARRHYVNIRLQEIVKEQAALRAERTALDERMAALSSQEKPESTGDNSAEIDG